MSQIHYEPSPRSRERAERMVDELIGERGQQGGGPGSDPTAIADVEADVERFTDELQLLSEVGMGVPVVAVPEDLAPISYEPSRERQFEDFVPVSLALLDRLRGDSWREQLYENPRLVTNQLQRTLGEFESSVEDAQMVSPETAVRHFRRRLTEFLGIRVEAEQDDRTGRLMRLPPRRGARPVAVPGCTFVVTTNSPGLRVFWSGAYFLTGNYFSAPTSPASSTLQSGTYLFGVDGGAYRTLTWDTRAQVTLPGTPSVHLNF
ncbi:hypothetical protein [Kribbella lupini]|uniref:Uncharacterized protein n=1 Tax=Kribbella lupini TaxID=291602 RepID=A0ABN2BP24_9ACTN